MRMRDAGDWIYNQSGVVPFRFREGRPEVMLITTHRRRRWIIPKGIIEPGTSAAESAEREAFEEAGLRGRVFPQVIGEYEYQKWGGTCHVRVFAMEVGAVLAEWPESSRSREWLSVPEASRRVRQDALRAILVDLESSLERILSREEAPKESS